MRHLELRASEDLVCLNALCAKLGEACGCRLSAVLGRLAALETLDLSRNGLRALPTEEFGRLRRLRTLNLAHNPLEEFPAGLAAAPALRELRVDSRTFEAFRTEWPRLEGVAVSVEEEEEEEEVEEGRRSS